MAHKSTRLGLRISPVQDSLIRAAATRRGLSITDFVLESACVRAEAELVERAVAVVTSAVFDRIMAEADKPPRAMRAAKSRLSRLARQGVRQYA